MPEAKEPKTRALFQFQSRGSLFRPSPCYTSDAEDKLSQVHSRVCNPIAAFKTNRAATA